MKSHFPKAFSFLYPSPSFHLCTRSWRRCFWFIIHYSGSRDPGRKALGCQTQRGDKFHFTIDFYSYCISSSLFFPQATWIMDFLSSPEFNVELQLSLKQARATNTASETLCPDVSQKTYSDVNGGGWGWLLSGVQLDGMIQMTHQGLARGWWWTLTF